MAEKEAVHVPPPKTKSITRENVPRGERPRLGGDPYANPTGNYLKNPPPRELDEYDEI